MSFLRTLFDMTRAKPQVSGRTVASDAALVITDTDQSIILIGSASGTKTATFNWTERTSAYGGARFKVRLAARSGGQYDIPCTSVATPGAVTLDAAGEAPEFQRIGSTLYVLDLGGATFA